MIRRPPRSTHCISSAASDVYKRQPLYTIVPDWLFNKWSSVRPSVVLPDPDSPTIPSVSPSKRSKLTSLTALNLSLIHISEPTRLGMISYAVFCLKKKKNIQKKHNNNMDR
eukprot:TRINITY_DN3813_c0_g1_i1.p3 TRINITY_DN3813_c0_g1~~TRINITY_DN3813_c0_g1_i1.p3  ORF type:complete len:111 (+),score=19.25 TRINITY_DN3813_c0_g1_i1:133-465(+)